MIAGREGIAIAKIITFSYEIHMGNIFRLFFYFMENRDHL